MEIPETDYPKVGRRILGCDACQLVCPRNADLKRRTPPSEMIDCMRLEKLLTKPDIDRMAKYIQLKEPLVRRQAALAAANTGRKDLLHLMEAFVGGEDEKLDKTARWAIAQIKSNKT